MTHRLIQKLVEKHHTSSVKSISVLSGGANNQAFKIELNDSTLLFGKAYSPSEPQSPFKLTREREFAIHLKRHNINNVPKPLYVDKKNFISIFDFIDGKKISQLPPNFEPQVMEFMNKLALASKDYEQYATEAVNKLIDFHQLVEKRLNLFKAITPPQKLENEFNQLIENISERTNTIYQTIKENEFWHQALDNYMLSPSDFGFHNALIADNAINFIDFEYAGLDSPWKIFSDFFSQPEIPIPLTFSREWLNQKKFTALKEKPATLLKVYELTLLKWCLIMLNEFKTDTRKRREFAWNKNCFSNTYSNDINRTGIKKSQAKQLTKSTFYFKEIDNKLKCLNRILKDT